MADSLHDQWPTATSEWAKVCAQFNAAWVSAFNVYNVNSDYAAIVAAIDYLAVMHMDATVMAGDMITHIAQAGSDNTRGLIQNFQNLEKHVLPQLGAVAKDYVDTNVTHEATDRVNAINSMHKTVDGDIDKAIQADTAKWSAAIAVEAGLRVTGDENEAKARQAADTAEANSRAAGDAASRQQAAAGDLALSNSLTAQINAVLKYAQSLPGLVDTRAAAGYDPTLAARATLLTKLLDTATAHEPLIASLVSRLATAIVDLAGVEDPVLRVAMQLILKQVIDRFGVDTALGAMINDLVGGILGGGSPKTLTTIMADIGGRLNALENGQSELSPLAPEADNLHEMGTLIFDASILAYLAGAVVDPVTTANDTETALNAVTSPLLAPIRAMLGM